MPKHRLFNSSQESPHLNSSRDEANVEAPSPKSKGKENANKYPYEGQRTEKNSNSTVQPHSFPKPGVGVESTKSQCADSNGNVHQLPSRNVSACVSDSDSMDEIDFFSRGNSNVKLPYTLQEDEFIVKYVLKGRNIFRASSVSLWKILESKKENPKRTYQSLKNRFLKSIKPRLFTTYSYLIKDKETENIILEKYPDLKRRGVKKDVFSALNLPKRPEITDFSDDDLNHLSASVSSSVTRNPSNQNQSSKINNAIDERKSEHQRTTVSETPNKNRVSDNEFTHLREVTVRKNATIVTVKFRKSLPKNPSTSPVGIYVKFLALKNQNNLVPCPTCSKLGFKVNETGKNPDESDSDSDDNFIPNSVETPDESRSKTPAECNRVRRSLPSTSKEAEKSPNISNSRKSKNNSKEFRKNPKNSNQRNSQESPAAAKGSKTIPANSNSNSNSSNLQNSVGSKELKQLLEDSYSRNILKKILSKKSPANRKKKTDSIPEKTSNSSNVQTPPSRNLRKSVRKRGVRNVSNDIQIDNIATRKQPRRNLDVAKPTITTTVVAEGSGSGLSGRPHLDRRAKKRIKYSRQLEKPKKIANAYRMPLRISTLTHRDRFILRKVLRRTYRIYRRDLLEKKKKWSKAPKRNLKKKPTNRERKKRNLQSQSESDSLNDNYLRSLYKETVAECRKLVDPDEEEREGDQNEVRNNTKRQNTVDNRSFDDEQLKSFFMESETDTEVTSSCTQNTTIDFNDTATSSLADNMMKMLSRF